MDPFFTDDEIVLYLNLSGYRRISNKFRRVARLDRPGGCRFGADYYRRCNAKDVLVLPRHIYDRITRSDNNTGYMKPHPHLDAIKKQLTLSSKGA